MIRFAVLMTLSCIAQTASHAASSESVRSPDGRIEAKVAIGDKLTLSIALDGKVALEPSRIGMEVADRGALGEAPKLLDTRRASVDAVAEQVVTRKRSELRDRHNALTLSFEGGYQLEVRAFDDGVGYRFVSDFDGEIEVIDETLQLRFPAGSTSLFPEEDSMMSHNERLYPRVQLAKISSKQFCSLPVLFEAPNGVRTVFTEADLYSYPAMYLRGGDGASLQTQFPKFVLKTKPAADGPDRNVEITREADYIAKTQGRRGFPWRVFVVSDRDETFLESELVYLLSRPLELANTDWIRPGRVAWDWYNANNIYGVDFKSGINNETYKYYIDFASKYGLEYVILDEGWSKSTTNVREPNPEIDVPELVRYGAERGVRIILWSLWGPVDKDAEGLFDLYKSWGVAGVKIDFMQRSDQYMVEYYERVARAAAKRQLLVDYHGSFKPAGLRRALPNVISYEGVKGNENNKWSKDITPRHNVTIPFTRMVAGPMDYTPGAMANANPRSHHINHFRPMGIGTRAHEVAKYFVYESPLQMLCDSPSRYLREPETTSYIARVPTVWDETIGLPSRAAEHVAVARRRGSTWYVGIMTNEAARSVSVDLSFLGQGEYRMEIFRDGANAESFAEDYQLESRTVRKGDTIQADLAPGGGWCAIISLK